MDGGWAYTLAATLSFNALLGVGYRIYRLRRGGPIGDVTGQAVLGLLLVALAALILEGAAWARWAALGYALLFGVAVMPLWVLAVLLPLPPERIDYAFTTLYWLALVIAAVAAIAA